MSFGKELGSLEAGRPVPFAEAFDFAQHRLNARFQDPIWSFAERFNSVGRRMRKAIKVVDDFTYDIIDERDRAEKEDGSTDLLSLYRNVRDEKGEGMSRKELRDAVLNLILAGRDTTAQVLSWSMFYIARVRPLGPSRVGIWLTVDRTPSCSIRCARRSKSSSRMAPRSTTTTTRA
jgi:hypothetical protein